MVSFILVPIYTDKNVINPEDYGQISYYFSYILLINVLLSYGMETAFFKFYNSENDKNKVAQTASVSVFISTITFLFLALIFRNTIAAFIDINVEYITYFVWILALDALVVIPFSILRATKRPMKYAIIKISNVLINLS